MAIFRGALTRSMLAIDDLLNLHAAEFCEDARVKEAQSRIRAIGGTLAYIADVQRQNREAMTQTVAKHCWIDGEYQGATVGAWFHPYIPLSVSWQPTPKATRQYFIDHGWPVPGEPNFFEITRSVVEDSLL